MRRFRLALSFILLVITGLTAGCFVGVDRDYDRHHHRDYDGRGGYYDDRRPHDYYEERR